jgi:hypothetical protein
MLMVIVMITGDFLSMSLTTDNVRPSQKPNAWSIGKLTAAGVILGVCLLSFCTGVLAVAKFILHLESGALPTVAFIVLVFGSQGTIYAIRERRHLWNSRPSLLLGVSSVVDIAIASTLAVTGLAMAPIPAVVVVGTLAAAVLFALVLDLIKIPIFAHLGIAEVTATPDAADEAKTKATPKTDGQAKPSDAKPAVTPQIQADPKAEVTAKTQNQPDAKKEAPPAIRSAAQPESKPDAPAATSGDPTPQMVKRVHQLYEALGREDVQAVQDWDKAQEKVPAAKQ